MSVVLSIEDVGPSKKQLKVEVPAPVVEAETKRVIEEFRRSARLPGFRKGKVPTELIRGKYSEDIEREVVERLLPRFWRQAEAEKELDPLLAPSVDEVNFRDGEALTFLATVELRPEIELTDIETFELPEMDTEPTDADMERAIEDMRRAVAEWVDVDRAAAQGDLVIGQLTAVSEDAEASPTPQDVRFEVGDNQVWEELSVEVTGKKAGQKGRFERAQGEGEESRTEIFEISIEAVRERDLPELDDELASRVGKFDSVADLEADIRQRLTRAKQVDRKQKRERALLDQLSERHPLLLPQGVVDQEIEGMLREYAQSLAGSGVDLENAEMDWQALAEQVRPQAERRVHARLLLDAVATKIGAEVDEDEFERTLSAIARAQQSNTAKIRRELDRSGRLAGLREQMRREKALKSLLGEDSSTAEDKTESESEGA